MITSLKNQTPGLIASVLNYPDPTSDRYVIEGRIATIAECNRYRAMIFKILSGWLKQRSKALEQFDTSRTKKANTLLLLLGVYEKATLQNICRFVVKNTDALEELAPGIKSRFYNHYQTEIVGLINKCKQQVA